MYTALVAVTSRAFDVAVAEVDVGHIGDKDTAFQQNMHYQNDA